jgi:hypothetical protein
VVDFGGMTAQFPSFLRRGTDMIINGFIFNILELAKLQFFYSNAICGAKIHKKNHPAKQNGLFSYNCH